MIFTLGSLYLPYITTLPTLHDQADTNVHNYHIICQVQNFTNWKSCFRITYSCIRITYSYSCCFYFSDKLLVLFGCIKHGVLVLYLDLKDKKSYSSEKTLWYHILTFTTEWKSFRNFTCVDFVIYVKEKPLYLYCCSYKDYWTIHVVNQ